MFINSTNQISLSFIIFSSFFVFFITIFFNLVKYKKIKIKFITTRNILFFSTIFGFIVGIIYSSFINFKKTDLLIILDNKWIWDCISFIFSLGTLLITICLLTAWIIIPFLSYRLIKKFLIDKNDISYELKKIGFIFLFLLISIGVSNIGWSFPLNDPSTPLNIFKPNNNLFFHDEWFVANRYMYDNCFLTEWYPYVFIAYILLNIFVTYIILNIKSKNLYFIDKYEKYVNKTLKLFHIFDSFGPLTSYCFICAYFLFNWEMLLIHIGYILMILAISFILIFIILLFIYLFKYKYENNKFNVLKEIFIISYQNHFYSNKATKKVQNLNLTDISIVGVVFIIYIGFANNYDVINNAIIYNSKLSSFNFWFQTIICGIIYNYITENRSYSSSWTKIIYANSVYSVTPGLQTGIFGWINPTFKPISNVINDLVTLII